MAIKSNFPCCVWHCVLQVFFTPRSSCTATKNLVWRMLVPKHALQLQVVHVEHDLDVVDEDLAWPNQTVHLKFAMIFYTTSYITWYFLYASHVIIFKTSWTQVLFFKRRGPDNVTSGAQIGGRGRRWLRQANLTSIRWLQVAHARHTVIGRIRGVYTDLRCTWQSYFGI